LWWRKCPFEAARMGCDVYASDLNPIAMLLTWAALNINGSSDEEIQELREFQKKIFELVDQQITEWGIEHNEERT
jgi:putative DNA methylase